MPAAITPAPALSLCCSGPPDGSVKLLLSPLPVKLQRGHPRGELLDLRLHDRLPAVHRARCARVARLRGGVSVLVHAE
eukprot:8099118-Lingulodinium_polyedra.AAC.1